MSKNAVRRTHTTKSKKKAFGKEFIVFILKILIVSIWQCDVIRVRSIATSRTPCSNMTLKMKTKDTMKPFKLLYQKDRRTEGMQQRNNRKNRCMCITLGLLLLAGLLMQETVQAQNINNGRTLNGYSSGANWDGITPGSGTTGSRGTWDINTASNWWGLSGTNNVLQHLNTGSVNVNFLDNSTNTAGYYTNSSGGYISTTLGPHWDNRDHLSAFSGTVNFTGTRTLTTSVDPADAGTPYGSTTRFAVNGTMTKQGTGTLSLQIEDLFIQSVIGEAGTLEIATNTAGSANPLPTGTLTSTTAHMAGGGSGILAASAASIIPPT